MTHGLGTVLLNVAVQTLPVAGDGDMDEIVVYDGAGIGKLLVVFTVPFTLTMIWQVMSPLLIGTATELGTVELFMVNVVLSSRRSVFCPVVLFPIFSSAVMVMLPGSELALMESLSIPRVGLAVACS